MILDDNNYYLISIFELKATVVSLCRYHQEDTEREVNISIPDRAGMTGRACVGIQ